MSEDSKKSGVAARGSPEEKRAQENARAEAAALGQWVYMAAMGEPLSDFAESFGVVREVADERSRLTSLIDQLLDIAQTAECPNCEYRFSNVKRGCNECEGARAAIQDAIAICVKVGRTAFGRSGPCLAPVTLDPPKTCPAEIPMLAKGRSYGDVSHAACSLPIGHPGAHHDKRIGSRWTDGDDNA